MGLATRLKVPQEAAPRGNRVSPGEESERDRSSVIGQHDFDRLVFGLKLVFLFLDRMSRSLAPRLGTIVWYLFVGLVEFDADNAAHALFLHGDAEENVRHADGSFVVRDDDELGVGQEPL